MKKFILGLSFLLCFQAAYSASPITERRVKRVVTEIKNGQLAEQTDAAISKLIRYASWQLYRKGYRNEARQIVSDYEKHYDRYLVRLTRGSIFTNIGDHKPLFDWLAAIYETIEIALGFEMCESLHLTDLKTLNYGLPVVFNPCNFDMGSITDPRIVEYRRHFAGKCDGEKYHGVAPVVTYWAVEIGCAVALWGSGFLICMPIASGAEFLMQNSFAQPLSDSVYGMACGS